MAGDVDYWQSTCLGHIKPQDYQKRKVLKRNQNTK